METGERLMVNRDYWAPSREAHNMRKVGWIREAIQEGNAYLKSQRAAGWIDAAREQIYGKVQESRPSTHSKISVNRPKRQVKEIVATMSNLRPTWAFKTDNPDFSEHAMVLNKLLVAWWHNTYADQAIHDALQYAAVEGRGYVSPRWAKDFWFVGRGDIALDVYGAMDVLPVQIGRDHDLQKAYAVIIRTERPINEARAMFPQHADAIQPSRAAPAGLAGRFASRVSRFLAPALQLSSGRSANKESQIFPVVDIYNIYILDPTINNTGRAIKVGKAGTNWRREIPYLGEALPDGRRLDGLTRFRSATREDALLYPQRRLIQATDNVILNDDMSPSWHGMVPVIPFEMDSWVFEFLGLPVIRDSMPLAESNNRLLRGIEDSQMTRIDPPKYFNTSQISKSTMEAMDFKSPGQDLGIDFMMGSDPIKSILPSQFYDLPPQLFAHIKAQEERMDHLVGLADFTALAKARVGGNMDALEKAVELAGPVLTAVSRRMERSMRLLGEMFKGDVFQFYTTSRRIQVLGPDGVVNEDFDYNPGDMVPSHFPGEDPDVLSGKSQSERARWFRNNFVFHIVPNSLHQVTQMSRKLLLLQLFRSGFPLDPWTIAEHLDIPNFGSPPSGTVVERWQEWNRMQVEEAAEAQLLMSRLAQVAQTEGMQSEFAQLIQGLGKEGGTSTPGGGQGGGATNGRGRPPTGQTAPHLERKDRGARTTISES